MSELSTILTDTANRLFTDHLPKEKRIAAEEGEWPTALWNAVEESGFPRVLVSEERGGAGASWEDAAVLLKACGTHAVPLPLAETIVAAWLLDAAGLDVPDGPLTFAEGDIEISGGKARLLGALYAVPYGADATHVVVVSPADGGAHVALFGPGSASNPVRNVAREPRTDLTINDPAVAHGLAKVPGDAAILIGALMRASGIAGALETSLAQAVQYAGERVQFGRPIAKFQAIQHQLAELATQAASVGVAVDTAIRAVEADPLDARFEIAVAKVRAADAAETGAGIAHQVHGAIGFTYEHGLHFWTRRLWSWAPEYGGATRWARELGRDAIAGGGAALWPRVTAR